MRDEVQLGSVAEALRRAMRMAWDAASDYAASLMTSSTEPDLYREVLQNRIEACHVQIVFTLELLQLPVALQDFKEGFAVFHEDVAAIEIDFWGDAYPSALRYMQPYSRAILSAAGESFGRAEGLQELERFLLATPKIVKDRGLAPQKESVVQKAVFEVLLHIFPDATREPSVRKVFKAFRPDIGIPSLKAAIEYKFVDSEADLKAAVGGIYEDVTGYSGSDDWNHFFAVFYMTDAYCTQAQIEAEFHLSGVPQKWKPLLVTGKGQRRSTSGLAEQDGSDS